MTYLSDYSQPLTGNGPTIPDGVFHGYVVEFIGKEENNGWEMKHFPAALACETYGNRTKDRDGNPTGAYDWQKPFAAPQSTSGWYLPSCAQLSDLYGNRSLLSSRMDAVKSCVPDDCDYRNHIKWFKEYAGYWSSTECDSAYAWFMDFSPKNAYALYDPKWTNGYVRAVLAF